MPFRAGPLDQEESFTLLRRLHWSDGLFLCVPELPSKNPMLVVAVSGLSVMSQSVPVISTEGGVKSGWLLLSYSEQKELGM